MLEPRGSETRGLVTIESGFMHDTGFLITDHRPPEYAQAVHRKNTVKELLKLRRQKWSYLQDDDNLECMFKAAKSEPFPGNINPHLLGHPAPVNSNITSQPAPENSPTTPQLIQHPALQGQSSATAKVELTLFDWQIQQAAQRLAGVSPELLNMQDGDGDTCLHIAVAQGRRAVAYVIATEMSRCGSVDVKEHNGQTALQVAAAIDHHLIVQDLLTHGAQINTRDLWGRSPLHVCAEKGHFLSLQSIWTTLMGSGQLIDIEMFNYDGFTPLHAAVLSHNAVVKELRCLENSSSMMLDLVQKRQMHTESVKILLLMGASFETKDLKCGRTCLHLASEEANVELLNIFLNQQSSLSVINEKTFSGNTALHIVSSLQNHKTQAEAVKLLMRKGADPGTRNFENDLPSQLVPEGPTGETVRQILKGKYFQA